MMNDKIEITKKPNIVITYSCNKKCSYCYASTNTKSIMSLKQFEALLDWYKGILTKFEGVTLLGGEPTLIPKLNNYLATLGKKGLIAKIYTNGTFICSEHPRLMNSEVVRECIFHYEPTQLSREEEQRFFQNMKEAKNSGIEAILRYNFNLDFNYRFILEIAEKYNVPLSWSISHPTAHGNPYIKYKQFSQMRDIIGNFLREARERNVQLMLGIPLPHCIYHEKDFLEYKEEFELDKKCTPIGDVNPDMSIQFCAVIPQIKKGPIKNQEELAKAIRYFKAIEGCIKEKYPFINCGICQNKEKFSCQGGCFAYRLYGDGS
ncbi:MAG: radical SAM protein [Candidatus Aenigmarchaeota archaeon]|nr:radical SAM protein [Candidatus Aenigmarchaeota archaeon]